MKLSLFENTTWKTRNGVFLCCPICTWLKLCPKTLCVALHVCHTMIQFVQKRSAKITYFFILTRNVIMFLWPKHWYRSLYVRVSQERSRRMFFIYLFININIHIIKFFCYQEGKKEETNTGNFFLQNLLSNIGASIGILQTVFQVLWVLHDLFSNIRASIGTSDHLSSIVGTSEHFSDIRGTSYHLSSISSIVGASVQYRGFSRYFRSSFSSVGTSVPFLQ